MPYRGSMGSFFLNRSRGDASFDRVALTKMFEKAFNARDMGQIALLVCDEMKMLDSISSPVEGRAAFISALDHLLAEIPDLEVEFADFVIQDSGLLVTGKIRSAGRGDDLASLWRFDFDGPLICQIQSFRADNTISLSRVARREGIGPV